MSVIRSRNTLFIGGAWEPPATNGQIDVVCPSTEKVIATVPEAAPTDIDRAVDAARRAFDTGPWPQLPVCDRAAALLRIAEAIGDRLEELAVTITSEVGAPLSMARAKHVPGAIAILAYNASLADTYPFVEQRPRFAGAKPLGSPHEASALTTILREPVGVVGAMVPWNGGLITAMYKLAPALLAGCTVVVKPPPETPLFGYVLAEGIEAAGLPEGVVSIVAGGREAGQHLVAHPGVDKVALTGSVAAGRNILGACAATMKRATLELGGKSAAIVLDDANLDDTLAGLAYPAVMNNGEACAAYTRVLAPRSRHDEVVDRLSTALRAMKVGDPFEPDTDLGPLITAAHRERVEGYIAKGKAEGASIALGGGRPRDLSIGWYVEPTVFVNVNNDMVIGREEIFGPVVSVIAYDSEPEAIQIANESIYGLAGGVFTSDPERGYCVARQIRAGLMSINGFTLDVSAPFGGFKQSGVGREGGPEGVDAYVEVKAINLPPGYQHEGTHHAPSP